MNIRFDDPDGTVYGLPTYRRRCAPEGLCTRRQLRARGLRPAGQDIAAQILWHGRRDPRTGGRVVRVAYLYRLDLAAPVRPMTAGRRRAVEAMMRARRTCRDCRITYDFCMPRSFAGCCPACADPDAVDMAA